MRKDKLDAEPEDIKMCQTSVHLIVLMQYDSLYLFSSYSSNLFRFCNKFKKKKDTGSSMIHPITFIFDHLSTLKLKLPAYIYFFLVLMHTSSFNQMLYKLYWNKQEKVCLYISVFVIILHSICSFMTYLTYFISDTTHQISVYSSS